MKYQHDEELLKMTRDVLSMSEDDFAENAPYFTLDIADKDMAEEDCILVLGLNPAGDWLDSLREQSGQTFFYYIGNKNAECDAIIDGNKIMENKNDKERPRRWRWTYKKYYKPIFDLAAQTVGNVKWGWCNREWEDIKEEIKSIAQQKEFEIIKESETDLEKFYNKHKKGTTIYIGDMFYYHDTDSNRLEKFLDPKQLEKHCVAALTKHIEILRKHNKNIRFVYINNAYVSKWLCGENTKTCDTINNVPIFFGGMLSMGIDTFSRQRLINEIKSIIYNNEKE